MERETETEGEGERESAFVSLWSDQVHTSSLCRHQQFACWKSLDSFGILVGFETRGGIAGLGGRKQAGQDGAPLLLLSPLLLSSCSLEAKAAGCRLSGLPAQS